MTETRSESSGEWLGRVISPRPVCLLWLGILVGVSVLEPPIRFSAPEMTYAVALDVGREVFAVLNRVELLLLSIVAVLAYLAHSGRRTWFAIAVISGIVAAQTFWLLPELAARSHILVGGGSVKAAPTHTMYAVAELLKMSCLAGIGLFANLRQVRSRV